MGERPAPVRQTLIALMGPMHAGKDTVGKVLVEQHGFVRYAFADAVKEAALALNPIVSIHMDELDSPPGRQLRILRLSDFVEAEGMEHAKAHPEVRRLLQRMGTEVGRDVIDPDVWVDIVDRRSRREERVVITDCRFPNEVAWTRRKGGHVVRIHRDGTGGGTHASEALLETIEPDFHFDNNGPLADLPQAVELMLKELATL